MNIYLVSQNVNNNYDTFDSFVVVANSEKDARYTHPSDVDGWDGKQVSSYGTWCNAEDVEVMFIGNADARYTTKTIICTSFNAG